MPDRQGRTGVYIPKEDMEAYVLPTQRRMYKETGKPVTTGLVVRYLMKLGYDADSSQFACHQSTGTGG